MSISALQAQCNAAMDVVFEYFKRENPVVFYKSAKEEIIIIDPNWNADFGNPETQNIIKSEQSKEISCRIWYHKEGELIKSLDGDENLGLKLSYEIGRIRIQIKAEDLEWLKDAKAFVVEDERFVKESDWRGLGMLQQFNRYEIVLRKNK